MADDLIVDPGLEEAKEKYSTFFQTDPFPEIEPSLLNSADIFDYVEKIGMIYPFYEKNLKPASYGVRLKGEYCYWDSTSEKTDGLLENLEDKDGEGNTAFILKRNSIAYVQLEPEFRLPSYIAARFNLKIKHIYQGLLLGTGPLVDPGYEGPLFVPLHNLTNNDYRIRIDVPMIWMEFTKLSSNSSWRPSYSKSAGRNGQYIPFDKTKLQQKKTLSNYLNDANPNGPVVSTILGFFDKIEKKVNEGEQKISEATSGVATATRAFNIAVIVAMLGISVTIGITIFQTANLNNRTIDYLNTSSNQIQKIQENLSNTSNAVNELREKVDTAPNSIERKPAVKKKP